MEETKKRLDTVLVDEQSTDGLLKVTITANRTIKSVTIADDLLQDKEQLEDYMI
jgi:DNA-binding protein YbaB